MTDDLLLADFELLFQIRLAHPPMEQPETESDETFSYPEDALPNEMDWAQPGHQDQARKVDSAQYDDRALAHRVTKNMATKKIADPSARSLDLKDAAPIM